MTRITITQISPQHRVFVVVGVPAKVTDKAVLAKVAGLLCK